MLALSIRQPWAWAIVHAGKRHENRSWSTAYRGPIAIHASKWWSAKQVVDTFKELLDDGLVPPGPKLTPRMLLDATGGIVGTARIVDCVEKSDSPWFVGPFGFVLDDVKALPEIIPCKGALGLFNVPADVAARIAP